MDVFEKIDALVLELDEHAQRLRARAATIKLSQDPNTHKLIAEVMDEFVSTGLDFQKETLLLMGEIAEQADPGEVGLTPEEASVLRTPLLSYSEMLEALIASQADGSPTKTELLKKRSECQAALLLVDQLELADEDDADVDPTAGDDTETEGDEGELPS